jgi:2,4-dienoyl-CoA reductase-like NADH-dependent reductase (Old Yellow Enzyme family)
MCVFERRQEGTMNHGTAPSDPIFQPLQFRNVEVKNRVFRSNISGRFDGYDGSGSQTRINWETRFARGGVGAIVSSFVPFTLRGRIVPNYAMIDRDGMIPFWRAVGDAVHEHDCKFFLQLSHAGRQRDIPGVEFERGLSSTSKPEPLHGFVPDRMTRAEIDETVRAFANGARRAREAGLDGVELHGANGYLITQFLSSAINDRDDNYGGTLANRARFVLEIVRAIRSEAGDDFHLQMKISARDFGNAVFPWEGKGNSLEESVQVCRWLEEAGVDAFHVSAGNMFPHPRNPAGGLPMGVIRNTYGAMASAGRHTTRNYLLFRSPLGRAFGWWWKRNGGPAKPEGISLDDAAAIKAAVSVPVICTGGFQSASAVRSALVGGKCDAVSIARSLIANNDLTEWWRQGHDLPPRPCTYCNRCLANGTENPLGCYDESRFDSRDAMLREVMSVFTPSSFAE